MRDWDKGPAFGDDTCVEALPLVLSGGWAAGVNAYATVLLLGIFGGLAEDFLVGGVVVLLVTHPWIALALSMTLLAIGLTLVTLLWRRVRAVRRRAGPTRARSAGS
jgi:hypothetical protein